MLALAALAVLGGCGGGSGAPNNPFKPQPVPPGPLLVLPATLSVYSNTPASLTVTGGVPPYFVTSSNPIILPLGSSTSTGTIVLLPTNVLAATAVDVTVTDSASSQVTAVITVNPAPIFNTLTVVPASATCGTNAICTGQTATATVVVSGPDGAPAAGRLVRFDVVTGAFAIQTTNPATPLVSSLTVASDVLGRAQVFLQATVGVPTQPAQLRATDVTSGEQQTAEFTIVQTINGAAVLSVVPSTVNISGPDKNTCSQGFATDYYIYGGTPPYTVAATFPNAVGLFNVPVTMSGGAFRAITNGTCVNPLVFTIRDATGLQTTATLNNVPGQNAPVVAPPPAALALTPASYSQTGCTNGTTTFTFIVSGGTPPYNVSTTVPGNAAASVNKAGGSYTVTWSGGAGGVGNGSVVAVDSGLPQQSATATINCS